ncbi:hypothetical protein [Paenibacillus illinoisensis]|uniref:Uncharacterized protein n=1 Tax=Paenibacillus illinoisensis TaxID=59845 RepID=A0A2W0C6I6_9BACL|nr:hypothetical protein [Paenibacillus illinoisensis]PYY28353.1 Uncharacterized protein PIL02S_03504 [Paenibacillus illinoisensis]
MDVIESTIIDVLNYSDSCVVVPTHIKPDGYLFEPAIDGEPYALQLSFSEIRGINSQSNLFREGFLRFREQEAESIYEKLGIRNTESILTDEEIKNIILLPTKSGLERLLKIQSSSMFERIRGLLVQLENSGKYDISTRVKNVITGRYKELYSGKRITEIVIRPTAQENEKVEEDKANSKVSQLEAEIEELKLLLSKSLNPVPAGTATEESKPARRGRAQNNG